MQMQVEGYTSLLTGYARAGDLEKAVSMLHAMKRRGVQPNEITYTSLIGAMALAGKIPQAEKMVAYMTESGVRPTVVTYNAFLTGLFSFSDDYNDYDGATTSAELVSDSTIEYAKDLLSDMLKARIRPDHVTVNLMLDAFGRSTSSRMDEALSILHAMEREGVVPRFDAKLYTTLIKGFGQNSDIAGARDAFYAIKRLDVFALNAFIDACCKCGDVKAGFKVYDEFVRNNGGDATVSIVPDAATFSTLISGLGRLDSVLVGGKVREVYHEMKREWKITPDAGLVDAVIAAMVGGGAKGLTKEDIQFTMKVLQDVEDIQWEGDGYNRRVNLVKGIIVRRFSEAWKEEAQEDAFLKSKGWNTIDSGFRLWSNDDGRRPDKADAFLDSKGWNDVDSSFRII
mmetsp:Transcript_18983/g.29325  ORF Transcript_18983/g.29325 Transcript_18983/m.29325 type:complete len:398 (-) Transcript_18983:111-1304(-)